MSLACWPVGSIFLSMSATSPATLLGGGTWSRIGQGRVLVGQNPGDPDFGTLGGTGGAKTSSISAHSGASVLQHSDHAHFFTPSVTVSDHPDHKHYVTTNVVVGDHPAHSHTVTSIVSVADHDSHTHDVTTAVTVDPHVAHTHNVATAPSTPDLFSPDTSASGVGGVSGNPNSALTHTVVNPTVPTGAPNPFSALAHSVTNSQATTSSVVQVHNVTNNQVISGVQVTNVGGALTLSHSVSNPTGTTDGTAALTHSVTQPSAHSAVSVLQPYLVVMMWERTA
jgi:hypothetical protein